MTYNHYALFRQNTTASNALFVAYWSSTGLWIERFGDRILALPSIFCHNKLNMDLQPQLKNTKFDTCDLDASRFHGVKGKLVWERKIRPLPDQAGGQTRRLPNHYYY